MKFAPGAWRYALVPLLVAPFALVFSVTLSVLSLLLGVATLAFFRDPERTPPPTGIVAPADGKISVIREEGDRLRLGVFMNVHNVHVVRAPFDARVLEVEHSPGAYKPAFSKDSDNNEQVHVRLETDAFEAIDAEPLESDAGIDAHLESESSAGSTGETETDAVDEPEAEPGSEALEYPHPEVTFIAGAFARRIHPYVDRGDDLERGQRLGHIAFGSRVDILFPPSVDRDDLAVDRGERLTAGETVVLESPTSSAWAGFEIERRGTQNGPGETDATGIEDASESGE